MKKEEAGESSLIRSISGAVYKTSRKFSGFAARLKGTKEESLSMVVFENGIVTEVIT